MLHTKAYTRWLLTYIIIGLRYAVVLGLKLLVPRCLLFCLEGKRIESGENSWSLVCTTRFRRWYPWRPFSLLKFLLPFCPFFVCACVLLIVQMDDIKNPLTKLPRCPRIRWPGWVRTQMVHASWLWIAGLSQLVKFVFCRRKYKNWLVSIFQESRCFDTLYSAGVYILGIYLY